MKNVNYTTFTIVLVLFLIVTLTGFAAARWRRAEDMMHLNEWGLGGRGFGTFVGWFLIGGDLYTAYTFIAVPAAVFGAGAVSGFFAVSYTIMVYPIALIFLPRLWSVARVHHYVTPADFVRGRYGSRGLSLATALTGILALLPYIALQLVGIEAVLTVMGVGTSSTNTFLKDLPLIIAFLVLAVFTYVSGLRAPALIAFIKDTLVYLVIIVAVFYIPTRIGGWGNIFAAGQAHLKAISPVTHKPTGVFIPTTANSQLAFSTLALGSALALFAYPHAVTGVLSTKRRDVIKRNMSYLPLYSVMLAFIALLGYAAVADKTTAANVKKAGNTQLAVPYLFQHLFPSWFTGIAFAAIVIGALVPAAIMSIAAANLFTRNIFREFFKPDASPRLQTRMSQWVSLVIKLGALLFAIELHPSFSINLQLLGGIWILQTFPALVFGLFTRWFHRWALLAGWLGGMIFGTIAAYKVKTPTVSHWAGSVDLEFGHTVYIGLSAFILNVAIALILTLVFKATKVPAGADETLPHQYTADPAQAPAPARAAAGIGTAGAAGAAGDLFLPNGPWCAGPVRWGLPAGNVAGMVRVSGHGGAAALAAARRYGSSTLFTLSGGHIFPLYDAAVKGGQPLRLVDVRHEQTAVFAAEATARLTRTAGLAAVTAGPGVTNAVSAVTTAWLNGAPVVVLAGRAPDYRWGQGSLQEIDHPPLLAPVTKRAWTEHDAARVAGSVDEAFRVALSPHRGPVFLDLSLEAIYGQAETELPDPEPVPVVPPDPADVGRIADLVRAARRPVLVLGSDVWLGRAEQAASRAAEELRLPVVANGQARGVLPRGHELLVTRARSVALREADLVLVVGAPLDFRLAYGSFGPKNDPAQVVHVADGPGGVAAHVPLAASAAGDLTAFLDGLAGLGGGARDPGWGVRLAGAVRAAQEADGPLLTSDAEPVHPARVYGELLRVLDEDAVVIGDGGDFVSFAGKYIEPARPGGWLDPGPFGCLGTGLGYAIAARLARPSAQVVLLLGDGAAGFSLMDADTLVRHRLPVVIVCGNNGAWGLEKHPMRALYGYDVLADLQPACRYDEVVRALGGAGELVTVASGIGPALRRAFEANVPYLVNVVTDPEVAYPRSTTGV